MKIKQPYNKLISNYVIKSINNITYKYKIGSNIVQCENYETFELYMSDYVENGSFIGYNNIDLNYLFGDVKNYLYSCYNKKII